MKAYPNNSQARSNSIGIFSSQLIRLTAVLLITALLTPIVFLGEWQRVSASMSLPIANTPASVSAPPEAFAFPASNQLTNTALSSLMAVNQSLLSGYRSVSDSIVSPAPPEGFAMAKVPTVWENVSGLVSSFAAAHIAPLLFAPSTVATAPAAPLLYAPGTTKFDFDGDGKADASRWQSASGEWRVKNSQSSTFSTLSLGTATAAAPADYDGDGKTDHATFTDWAGRWKIRKSSNGQIETVEPFGLAGDRVVSGNYDGDTNTVGIADLAVWRPSNATWYVRQSSNQQVFSMQFGVAGDIPVPGNYDGDTKMDYAVFRPSNGHWYLRKSASGYADSNFQWGASSDTPVPADYDGDGKTDFAVYRPSNGTWYINRSNGSFLTKIWGNYGDQPVPADYDGDGKDDFAVWRQTTGVWYVVKSSDPTFATYEYHQLGIAGDTAVPSAYLKQIGGQVLAYNLANARLAPKNATGGADIYSRNFSWGTSLVNLPGRAGLDVGLGISYNSLVWTKEPTSNTMVFDADNANVSPGFRFGFPTIEPSYYNALTQKFSFMMVTPSGGRVEFRQHAASSFYKAEDSSYASLVVVPPVQQNPGAEELTLVVTTTDGTRMVYVWRAGAYRCAEIKDPNGNFISIAHDGEHGLLRSLTDTLGRVVTVEYDDDFAPVAIKQYWKADNGAGAPALHTYATFTYTYAPISPNFAAGITVFGPSGGANVKVLEQVLYPTGARTVFEYNAYGQVFKVRNVAADLQELNSVRTDLQTPTANQTDCPRFSTTYNKVKNFNNNQETVIHNTLATNVTYTGGGGESLGATDVAEVWMDGDPNTLRSKTWYHTAGNWTEGLPLGTEDIAGGVRKRWTRTVWTQDDLTKTYKVNPRVVESRVGDATNTKKTTIEYRVSPGTNASIYGLPSAVKVYDADQTTVLKKAVTEYNLDLAYLERGIIGLPKEQRLYEGESSLQSKTTYGYDEGDFSETEQGIPSVIRHDTANYSSSFIIGRGNPTSITRCDAGLSSATECIGGITSHVKYNLAGAPVSQIDPLGRELRIGYADSFNDGGNGRNTFAYPTKLTEVANAETNNNFSTIQYRYDIGTNVRAQSPVPAGQAQGTLGKITTRIFDAIGRLEKQSVLKNGVEHAYTRYEYPANQIESKTFTTAANGDGEVAAESKTDGAGRAIESRTELPNSLGWSGVKTEYDILGRVKRQTVPTEVNASWDTAAGDDFRGYVSQNNPVFLWTTQDYDWKGRVIKQTNTDGTFKSFSYQGCGCAGNQVTTVQGEEIFETDWQGGNPVSLGRRTQKIYEDVLGRTVKTEIMNWNGVGAPYATTVTAYNGRDQAESVTRTDNGTPPLSQVTTLEYDGHGRLKKQHRPEQIKPDGTPGYTTYNYNADDSIESVMDARGASTNYVYNNRGLLEQVNYSRPAGSSIQIPATVNFTYDALGNRISMTETTNPAGGISGLGGTTYAYDALSRLKSETRTINDAATGFNQSFTFNYEYNLAGQLTNFSDPNDTPRSISYTRDKIGRVTAVKNNQPNRFANVEDYATNIQYRAFGAVKSLTYGTVGTGKNLSQTFNNRLQLDEFNVSGGGTTPDNLASKNKYYADGRIKSAGSLTGSTYENKFDRLYKYDHQGRIIEAKSGIEARDPAATSVDRPYRQTYDYNAFGNLTNRTGKVWDREPAPMTANYTNNRRTDQYWNYDADGRNTANEDFISYYDAAGRRYLSGGILEITQTFDGDGRRIKQTEDNGSGQNVKKRYYVNSSVLGTIYEIEFTSTTNWRKKVGLVYLNGQQIAVQNQVTTTSQTVSRLYENPVTGSTRGNDPKLASEPDALGVNAGTTAPPPEPPDYDTGASDLIIPRHADALNLAAGCTFDGMPISCDVASSVQDAIDNYEPGVEPQKPIYIDPPMPDFPSPPGEPSPESPTTALVFAQGFEAQVKVKRKKGGKKEKKNQKKSKSAPVRREIKPTPLSGKNMKDWTTERDRLLAMLRDTKSPCYIFLNGEGFDIGAIIDNLENQIPYDALSSGNDANQDFGEYGTSVKDYLAQYQPNFNAASGEAGRIYYDSSGLITTIILHETIHVSHKGSGDLFVYDPKTKQTNQAGKRAISDSELQTKLGITVQNDSTNIDTKLEQEGCK